MVKKSKVNLRDRDIFLKRAEGATLQSIANEYGITKERVRQIIEKHFPRNKRSETKVNKT